jgi:hypothetical protein
MSRRSYTRSLPKVICFKMPTSTAVGAVTKESEEVMPDATLANESDDVVTELPTEPPVVTMNQPDYLTPNKNDDENEVATASDVPIEISAKSSTGSSRKNPPSSMSSSILSPSPTTRSQTTTRKRSTPDKFVPDMVSTKRRIDLTGTTKRSKSSNGKAKMAADVEIVDDDSTVVHEAEVIPVIGNDKIRELERDSIRKKSIADLDPDNTVLSDASEAAERKFLKSLFEIKLRNGSRIT